MQRLFEKFRFRAPSCCRFCLFSSFASKRGHGTQGLAAIGPQARAGPAVGWEAWEGFPGVVSTCGPPHREVKEHCVDPSGLPSGLLLLLVKGLSGPAQGKTLLWEWGSQLRGAVRLRSLCCGVPLPSECEDGPWTVRCCAGLRSGSSNEKPVAGAEVRAAAVGQTLARLRLLP